MYCNHYGFSEKPFDVTPDPRFLYLTLEHRETLASIIYGIKERRGFITVIGEVGTGKTTLLNAALDRMDDKTKVAFIFNTDVTFVEMLNMALYEWGLAKPIEKLSKGDAIQLLNRFAIGQLAKGGNVVLIVDEAQNLDNNVMENLRLLSNLETRRYKLIQIVLSGQPELDTKLCRHELRQLAQRISLWRYIHPLNEKDTYAYLQHRLKVAKHNHSSLFTDKAQKLIWEYSGGVPRRINILCDNAFLIGYGLKKNKINPAVVKEAAQDLKWHRFSNTKASLDVPPAETSITWVETKPSRRPLRLTATIIIAGILIFAGSYFLNERGFQLVNLAGFISNIKDAAMETVLPVKAQEQVQISRSDIPEPGIIKPKIIRQKVPEENLRSETRVKSKTVSYLRFSNYHLIKEKSPERIVQDDEAEKMRQVRALSENDRSGIQFIDEEKSNLTTTEVQVDEKEKSGLTAPIKEEIIRQIVVENGDTLGDIIIHTYGEYDDVILKKVQRQNPKIIDPDLILPGQIIKLPADKE